MKTNLTNSWICAMGFALGVILYPNTAAADPNSDLLSACKDGNLAKVQQALQKGADVNTRDKSGFTPIMHAVGFNRPNIQVLTLLLERKADPNAVLPSQSGWGGTLPKKGGDTAGVISILIKVGTRREVRTKGGLMTFRNASQVAVTGYGLTALMMASFRGDLSAVELLLKSGADPNLTSTEGYTALMFAVLEAPIDAASRAGSTVLDLAPPGSPSHALLTK